MIDVPHLAKTGEVRIRPTREEHLGGWVVILTWPEFEVSIGYDEPNGQWCATTERGVIRDVIAPRNDEARDAFIESVIEKMAPVVSPKVPVLPLPNDRVGQSTVIASMWQRDDEEPIFALVMLLHAEPPYYGIYEITWKNGAWEWQRLDTQPNIVPATEAYQQHGGDY